jgi:Flp pilus assembly protein TadG
MKLSKQRQLNQAREKGYTLVLGIFAFLFIIPMLGLVVDVGFLYGVKGQLQASVDGAALASARALTLGATTSAQATSAKQTAVNWFYANFPPNTWGTKNTVMDTTDAHVMVYDDSTNPNLRHVDVLANTSVPTYFMKWFEIGRAHV